MYGVVALVQMIGSPMAAGLRSVMLFATGCPEG